MNKVIPRIHFLKKRGIKHLALGIFILMLVLSPVALPFSFSSSPTTNQSTAGQLTLSPRLQLAHAKTPPTNIPAGKNAKTAQGVLGDTYCLDWNSINIPGCLSFASYYVFYWPAAQMLILSGDLFDTVLAFSLSPAIASGGSVVQTGWGITRDLVNGLFVFLLLYIAISLILQLNTASAKRMLISLIAVGLLINFSLFFSHVVIDASNVAAVTFYEHIKAPAPPQGQAPPPTAKVGVKQRSISQNVSVGLKPQKLLSVAAWNNVKSQANGSSVNFLLFFFLAMIIAGVINFIAAIAFLGATFLFLIRIISLWLLMIMAPIAFLGFILPKSRIGGKWVSALVAEAFVAPVFLFLFYLLVVFIDNNAFSGYFAQTTQLYQSFIVLLLSAFFYIGFLVAIIIITAKVSKGSGNMGVSLGKQVGGRVLGAGVSTAGFAGRHTVGKGLNRLANSEKNGDSLTTRLRTKGGLGRFAASALDKGAKSSFDVKNTKAGSAFAKQTKMNLGKGHGEGGFAGAVEKENKTRDEIAKSIKNDELRAQFQEKRLNEKTLLGRKTAERRALEENPELWENAYKNVSTEEGRIDVLSRAGKPWAAKKYKEMSDEDRAKLRKKASEMGGANDALLKELQKGVVEQKSQPIPGGYSEGVAKAEREEQEKKAKKADTKLRTEGVSKEREKAQTEALQAIEELAGQEKLTSEQLSTLSGHMDTLNAKNASNLSSASLNKPEVVKLLNNSHLAAIGKDDSISNKTKKALGQKIVNDNSAAGHGYLRGIGAAQGKQEEKSRWGL